MLVLAIAMIGKIAVGISVVLSCYFLYRIMRLLEANSDSQDCATPVLDTAKLP